MIEPPAIIILDASSTVEQSFICAEAVEKNNTNMIVKYFKKSFMNEQKFNEIESQCTIKFEKLRFCLKPSDSAVYNFRKNIIYFLAYIFCFMA